MQIFHFALRLEQWGSHRGKGGLRGHSAPFDCEKVAKNRENKGKIGKKRGKIGKKRQKSGRFFHFALPYKQGYAPGLEVNIRVLLLVSLRSW